MYYIQLDADTSLQDISALPDIDVVALLAPNRSEYLPAIKFRGAYILIDVTSEDTALQDSEEGIKGYINGDLKAITLYVNNDEYVIASMFQDFIFAHGYRSSMMQIA